MLEHVQHRLLLAALLTGALLTQFLRVVLLEVSRSWSGTGGPRLRADRAVVIGNFHFKWGSHTLCLLAGS